MDKQEIVALLRRDMVSEHQAIVQYLFHAYVLGEGELACEIEGIAREEMRHLDWLADAITGLGGDPSMDRDPVDFTLTTVAELMTKDVGLEQGAIDQYRAHIEAIDDPGLQRLLSRILADELVHHGQFDKYAEEFADDAGMAAKIAKVNEDATGPGERTGEILNQGIRHEYTVVLQYLYHSFMAKGKEEFEELQNTAINEMQHMGWLAEAMASRGGHPDMSHAPLFLSHDLEANLEADIAVEQEVTRDYTTQMPELDDPDLQSLVQRIRDHEIYHDTTFKELLAEVREEAEAADAEAAEAEGEEPPCSEAKGDQPQGDASPTPPTLGSLLGRTQN